LEKIGWRNPRNSAKNQKGERALSLMGVRTIFIALESKKLSNIQRDEMLKHWFFRRIFG